MEWNSSLYANFIDYEKAFKETGYISRQLKKLKVETEVIVIGSGLHLPLTRIMNSSEDVGQKSKSILQSWSFMGLGRRG